MINKALLAAAVAGALTAPGLALAQASSNDTNVQIYGLFDVRYEPPGAGRAGPAAQATSSASGTG